MRVSAGFSQISDAARPDGVASSCSLIWWKSGNWVFILPIPAIGVPELLGGFATGLALSRRFFIPFGVALRADPGFSSHVHDQMKPIIHLFTPVFFVTVGLSLD